MQTTYLLTLLTVRMYGPDVRVVRFGLNATVTCGTRMFLINCIQRL